MEGITDIRRYKSALRLKYKNWRSRLSSARKLKLDEDILGRMLRLNQYAVADTVLTYVSKDREVDTRKLIARAVSYTHLDVYKRQILPRVVDLRQPLTACSLP